MDKIKFIVGEQEFVIEKEVLTDKSLYFKAMFCGSYAEVDNKTVAVELFEPQSIEKMVYYLENNDLKEGDVDEMIDLLKCSTYFQIDSLILEVETKLFSLVNCCSWIQILKVAIEVNRQKLAQIAELYGMYEFEDMLDNVSLIRSYDILVWYLKHPKLYVKNEFQVFMFGEVWIRSFGGRCSKNISDIMKLLDFHNLTVKDIEHIGGSSSLEETSRVFLDCIKYVKKLDNPYTLLEDESLQLEVGNKFDHASKEYLMEMLKRANRTGPNFSPAMMLNKQEKGINFIYRMNRQSAELEPWLEVNSGNRWVYSVTSWGAYKVVVTCGESGGKAKIFQRRVLVWDELRQSWNTHDVELPCMRSCATVVYKDVLYLIGRIGLNCVVLGSGLAYDLMRQSWTHLPVLPERIQHQNPAICIHNNEVYVGIFTKIYVLRDSWEVVVDLNYIPSFFCSYGDDLYVSGNYKKLTKYNTASKVLDDEFAVCHLNVAGICSLGSNLFAFTEDSEFRLDGGFCHVERLNLNEPASTKPEIIWSNDVKFIKFHYMPGCFAIASFNQCI